MFSSEIVQGVEFFSTKGLELRYVLSRVYNLNGTQQLNMPALACDVLPRMLAKKIKNNYILLGNTEGRRISGSMPGKPIQILGVTPPPPPTRRPALGMKDTLFNRMVIAVSIHIRQRSSC